MHPLEKISVYRLRVPLITPYRLSFGLVKWFDTVIVEIIDRNGEAGIGEATVLTGYTKETIDDSWRTAMHTAQLLADDPDSVASRLTALVETFPFTATAFKTALEMLSGSALLDISDSSTVPLVGLLHATTEAAIETEMEELLNDGFLTIKVKIGFDLSKDIRLVHAVQKTTRGRARIRLDANQGYTAPEAIEFVNSIEPTDIELFEQPCPADDWDSHLAVVRASSIPMMLDESIYGSDDIERAARLKAAAFIKVKLMKLGSLAALAESLERIMALGMRPVLGNGVACDLGCWMEACIAAKHVDNAGEMNGFLKPRARLLDPPLVFREGAIVFEPGFRPHLEISAVREFAVDSIEMSARQS